MRAAVSLIEKKRCGILDILNVRLIGRYRRAPRQKGDCQYKCFTHGNPLPVVRLRSSRLGVPRPVTATTTSDLTFARISWPSRAKILSVSVAILEVEPLAAASAAADTTAALRSANTVGSSAASSALS